MTTTIEEIINNLSLLDETYERPVRILSEYLKVKQMLEKHQIYHTIVMLGSARILPEEHPDNIPDMAFYYTAAYDLAYKLALWSKEVGKTLDKKDKHYICTGGGGGIMEAANRGATEAKEKSLGFNIDLPFEQKHNIYLEEELVFNFSYFFLRKYWFVLLAKAFVVFPGGFGTMDELYELLTLIQTRKIKNKIPLILFGVEFFKKILNLDMLVNYGLISESDKNLFLLTDNLEEAYNYIIDNISNSHL